ncbi:MAG TPA: YciI family protein [Pyrinomonadaceae bacterium]|nr:YciI family protein [Pyrinomonadaceae bacterium]
MRYILLIYHAEEVWNGLTDAQRQDIYGEYRNLIQELQANGNYIAGDELQPTATATSIKVREGEQLITDGPFAETREQVGGFFLIEAKDQAEAVKIAARIPSARMGTIEVRPVAVEPAAAGQPA